MSATIVPSGTAVRLCECGCGQPTQPYTSTRSRGDVRGEPARFLRGHVARRREEVPTAVLREAFGHSRMSRADVARSLGWRDHRGVPDGLRFARAIGLKPQNIGHGAGWKIRQTTSYGRAVTIVLAMGLDPVDYDL